MNSTWLTLSVFSLVVIIIFLLYLQMARSESRRLNSVSEIMSEEAAKRLEAWIDHRMSIIPHLAEEWNREHKNNTNTFVQEATGFQVQFVDFQAINFIDPQGVIELFVPNPDPEIALPENEFDLNSPRIRETLERARAEDILTITPIIRLRDGRKGFAIFFGIRDDNHRLLGFTNGNFIVNDLMDACFSERGFREKFRLSLRSQTGETVFQSEELSSVEDWSFQSSSPLSLVDQTWTFTVAPTATHMAEMRSFVDEVFLLGSLIMAALTTWLVHGMSIRRQALLESREQIARIYTAANDAILIIDPVARHIVDANPRAVTMFDYDQDNLTQLPVQYIHSENSVAMREFLTEVAGADSGFTDTVFCRTRTGHLFPTEISASTIQFDRRPHILAMIRDISERKKAESELRESESRLTNAQRVAHMGDWDWIFSTNGLSWSNEMFRIFGLSEEGGSPSFESFMQSVHPDDRLAVQRSMDQTIHDDAPFHLDYRIVKPTGEVRHVYAQGEVEYNGEGIPHNLVGTVLDITEQKQAEDRIVRLQDDLTRMSRVSTMGAFAAGLTHEISQPLHAIVNYANGCVRMLESGSEEREKIAGATRRIAQQAGYAGEILRRLKSMMVKGEMRRSPTNINDIIEEVGELVKGEVRRRGVSLHLDMTPNLPDILVNRVEIQQVLVNLVRNSCEAMQASDAEDRRITIRSADSDPDCVSVSVGDTGCGVPPDTLNQLFDSFYTTKPEGMGMGLAISRTIIESHEGKLWHSSDSEYSTIFTFNLPIQNGDLQHDP